MRILAVDDDPLQLDLLRAVLAEAGYQNITTAGSGAAALHLIAEEKLPFDCVMLDIQMPDLNGIDLCRMIRSIKKYDTVPIIMITALSDRQFASHAFRAGATDYVTKPFDNLELITRTKVATSLREASQSATRKGEALEAMKVEFDSVRRFSFTEAVVIENVPCVIDYLLLQNQMLQLTRFEARRLTALALRIAEFHDLHNACEPAELHDILEDVAEAIAEQFIGKEALISYTGAGVFVCIQDRTDSVSPPEIRENIQTALDLLGFTHPNGKPYSITVLVGRRCRAGLLSSAGALQILEDAVLSVSSQGFGDEKARQPKINDKRRRLPLLPRSAS